MCPRQLHMEATGHGTHVVRTFPVLGIGGCVCECMEALLVALLLLWKCFFETA